MLESKIKRFGLNNDQLKFTFVDNIIRVFYINNSIGIGDKNEFNN